MRKITFGLLRFIEVFEKKQDNEQIKLWENFIEKVVFKNNNPEDYTPFGVVNGMHPLMQDTKTGKVYVFEPLSDSVLLIANAEEQFSSIIEDALKIWQDFQNVAFLGRDKATMEKYKAFTARFDKQQDIHLEWWVNFAFKELNINLTH